MAAEVAGILGSFVAQGPGKPADPFIRYSQKRLPDGNGPRTAACSRHVLQLVGRGALALALAELLVQGDRLGVQAVPPVARLDGVAELLHDGFHAADLQADADIDVYFCNPHSPWQRPSNEHMNGLLRQYFPKGTDLNNVTLQQVRAVAIEMNGRPRKVLNWRTPAEVYHDLVAIAA